MSHSPTPMDVLIEQIGRLTEVVTVGFQDSQTETRDIKEGLTELKAMIERQSVVAERQAETARLQAESISRLIDRLQA
jgi:hypothetical protein